MPVYYDSKQIIPGPLANIQKQNNSTSSGQKFGAGFVITVTGTMLPHRGSPIASSGNCGTDAATWWTGSYDEPFGGSNYPPDQNVPANKRLAATLRKQEAFRELFSNDGRDFEIIGFDGSAPLKCNPRVRDIQFNENVWYNRCDYTITLEADIIYINGTEYGEDNFVDASGNAMYLSDISEEWTIEENDGTTLTGTVGSEVVRQTYRLTHNLSATGKHFYDETGSVPKQAWEYAKAWVEDRLGVAASDYTIASGVIDLPVEYRTSPGPFNKVRTINTNQTAGQYSVNETWILAPHNALEEYTVNTTTNSEDSRQRVTIEGRVIGMDNNFQTDRNNKYDNATTKFSATTEPAMFTRASVLSGLTLNSSPLSNNVSRDKNNGIISYTYEYDDRPGKCIDPSGILNVVSEEISITDNNPGQIFAEIPILGRAEGPILQDIATYTARKRSISIELVLAATDACVLSVPTAVKSAVDDIINQITPSNVFSGVDKEFKNPDDETWSTTSRRYSRNVQFTYEIC